MKKKAPKVMKKVIIVRNKDMADKSDAEVEQAIKQRGNRCRREEE